MTNQVESMLNRVQSAGEAMGNLQQQVQQRGIAALFNPENLIPLGVMFGNNSSKFSKVVRKLFVANVISNQIFQLNVDEALEKFRTEDGKRDLKLRYNKSIIDLGELLGVSVETATNLCSTLFQKLGTGLQTVAGNNNRLDFIVDIGNHVEHLLPKEAGQKLNNIVQNLLANLTFNIDDQQLSQNQRVQRAITGLKRAQKEAVIQSAATQALNAGIESEQEGEAQQIPTTPSPSLSATNNAAQQRSHLAK